MLKVANSVISASRITGVLPVANGGTGVTTSTGTGNTVLSASPTFTGTIAAASQTLSATLGVTGVSTLTDGAVIQGLTVGKGAGAVASNTAVGVSALAANTTSGGSTCVGYQAGLLATGALNTFIGSQSGGINACAGQRNVGAGDRALASLTSGNNNIGFGFTDSVNGYSPVFDPTTESNRVVMGHTAVTNAYVNVAWTVTSDQRDKTNITNLDKGLDFVKKLQPKQYQLKTSRVDDTPSGKFRYGFLAQDILVLEGNEPIIIDNEKPDHLKYQGESLVPILVKAIQELSAKFEAYKLTHP